MDQGPGTGRVLMIVRANSPRNGEPGGAGGGGGANGDAALQAINLGALETDWRQQQFQRQRMQLLSMAIFLCFMVLFFDNRAGDSRQTRTRVDTTGRSRYAVPHDALNDSDRLTKVHAFEDVLHRQQGYRLQGPPLNVTGIYSGMEALAIVHLDYITSKSTSQERGSRCPPSSTTRTSPSTPTSCAFARVLTGTIPFDPLTRI